MTDEVLYEEHQAPDAGREWLWVLVLEARPYVGALIIVTGVVAAFQGEWAGAAGCAVVGSLPLLWSLIDDGTMHVVLTTSKLDVRVGRHRSHVYWPVTSIVAATPYSVTGVTVHDRNWPWLAAVYMGVWWYERFRIRVAFLHNPPTHGVLLRLRGGKRVFIASNHSAYLMEAIREVVGDRLSPDPWVLPGP